MHVGHFVNLILWLYLILTMLNRLTKATANIAACSPCKEPLVKGATSERPAVAPFVSDSLRALQAAMLVVALDMSLANLHDDRLLNALRNSPQL